MPSRRSDLPNSDRSTVIRQAMNLTSASRHRLRSSSSEATRFFSILAFVIEVAIACTTGRSETIEGTGMAGLPTGLASRCPTTTCSAPGRSPREGGDAALHTRPAGPKPNSRTSSEVGKARSAASCAAAASLNRCRA